MFSQDRTPVWSALALSALLLMLTAGAALAVIPSTSGYRNATQPKITGTVLMVNDHEMRVATEQGSEVMLTLDSRSVVPTDLAADMMVRVEFHYLTNGTRHAERVTPVRHLDEATRELSYSYERDADARFASTAGHDAAPATRGHARGTYRTSTAPMTITPATRAYVIATKPMIAGHVVQVNDHRIVVDSDRGGPVTLQMDSRTLVPSTLQSGMGVRVDYKVMEDGEYLARRITEDDLFAAGGDDNLSHMSDDQEGAYDAQAAAQDNYDAVTAANQGTGGATSDDYGAAEQGTDDGRLPQTASPQPLMALAGLLALGAGALALRRRR